MVTYYKFLNQIAGTKTISLNNFKSVDAIIQWTKSRHKISEEPNKISKDHTMLSNEEILQRLQNSSWSVTRSGKNFKKLEDIGFRIDYYNDYSSIITHPNYIYGYADNILCTPGKMSNHFETVDDLIKWIENRNQPQDKICDHAIQNADRRDFLQSACQSILNLPHSLKNIMLNVKCLFAFVAEFISEHSRPLTGVTSFY